jgi:hypothetical protein
VPEHETFGSIDAKAKAAFERGEGRPQRV